MTEEQTPDFPAELLVAESGTISNEAGKYSIAIQLRSFEYDGEDIVQTLEIFDLKLPEEKVEELPGKEFIYPANPDEGYVETSIYIWSVHNPIDVLRIKFGEIDNETIESIIDLRFDFEYEGCCNNLDKTFTIALKIIKTQI